MKNDSQLIALGDLVDIKHGYPFQGDYFSDRPNDKILLTPGNFAIGGGFKDNKFKFYTGFVPDGYVLNEGDLIVTMTDLSKSGDTLGYPALVPKPNSVKYLHNQRLGKVIIKEPMRLDKLFLYYLLCSRDYRNEVLATATGTTVRHTSPDRIKAFKFKIPPIAEQKLIARILGSLDDKIHLNRKNTRTLDTIAQTLFKRWFVNFEFPNEEDRPYRSSGGEMVDSKVGKIPKNWEIKKIEEVTDAIFSGGTPDTRKREYWKGEIPWLSSGETGNRFIVDTLKKISQIGVDNSSTKLARKNDTVVASAGQGSTRGQVSFLMSDVYINQSIVAVRTDMHILDPYYIFYNLASRYDELRNISDSHSSRGSLTTKLIGNLNIIIPPRELIIELKPIFNSILERTESNLKENVLLYQIRELLLPKLLSARIEMKASGMNVS